MSPKSKHGGKRKGAGRKPALFPAFNKKFRATDEERAEFMALLTGDARRDFVHVLHCVKHWRTELERGLEGVGKIID